MRVQVFIKGQRDSSPVLEGDPVDVSATLIINGTADLYEVYDGSQYTDAREFVVSMGGSLRPLGDPLSAQEKMRYEDLTDPVIHARNELVVRWIAMAIRLSQQPNYQPDLVAKNTAHEIIRLFY